MKLVIDTNVLIPALIKEGFMRDFIINQNYKFELISPAYVFSEIMKYKQYILKKARIDEKEFYSLLATLMKYVSVINPIYYNSFLDEADKIIGHIHKSDVVFIATALAFSCAIWSDDKHFKMQDVIKVYTTDEVVELLE